RTTEVRQHRNGGGPTPSEPVLVLIGQIAHAVPASGRALAPPAAAAGCSLTVSAQPGCVSGSTETRGSTPFTFGKRPAGWRRPEPDSPSGGVPALGALAGGEVQRGAPPPPQSHARPPPRVRARTPGVR